MKRTNFILITAVLLSAVLLNSCQNTASSNAENTSAVPETSEEMRENPSALSETEEETQKISAPDEPVYPVFAQPGGLYGEDEEIVLEMAPSQPLPEGYKIFYTNDGNEPNMRENEYSKPVHLLQKSEAITIRAACFDPDGTRIGPIVTQTFLRNRENRFDGKTVVCVTATDKDLKGSNGIFTNPTKSGKEWERPAHIEIISTDGEKVVDQDGGVRVFGGSSRILDPKSLRLIARNDDYYDADKYQGKGSFAYPLFDGRLIEDGEEKGTLLEKYDRFILRNGGNDALQSTAADPLQMNLLRDNVSNTFAAAVAPDLTCQASAMAIVFLNGEYYGILDMKEDVNDNYIRNVYGLPDKENITVIKSEADTSAHCDQHSSAASCRFCNVWFFYEVDDGDPSELDVLTGLLKKTAGASADDAELWAEVENAFDLDSLIQYYALNLYLINTDWPHNNVRLWRYAGEAADGIEITDGKWRFSLRDMDFTMGRYDNRVLPEIDTSYDVDMFRRTLGNYWEGEDRSDLYPDSLLLQGLLDFCLQNEDFRTRFTEYCRSLASDANRELLKSVIDTAAESIRSEIPYHLTRWKGTYDHGYTMENWEAQVEHMKEFAEKRPEYFLEQLDAAMARY